MNSSILPLVELTLKGSAVLLAGYAGAALLARASAAKRSLCWLGVFVALLFLPLALLMRPLWSVPLPAASAPGAAPEATGPALQGVSAPGNQPLPEPLRIGAWLAAAYGCGVAGVLGFRLLGAAQLWKIRRASTPDADGQGIVDGWRQNRGMRRRVQVCVSARVLAPMTCGTWRPVILLPADSAGQSDAERHAVLQHEYAHILHWDAAGRWLGTIVSALWWPHPLVWSAVRAWKLEQERACDDAVLNGGADAVAYAQQLLEVARQARLSRLQTAGALVMAMPGGLETRLRSLTSPGVNRSPASLASRLAIGLAATVVILCGIAFQAQSASAAPQDAASDPATKALIQKAETVVIPQLDTRESTVRDVIEQITKASGIKFFYTPKKESDARITLHLTNIPTSEAIRYLAGLASLNFTYKKDGVYLRELRPDEITPPPAPAGALRAAPAPGAPFFTKEWKISRAFMGSAANGGKPLSAQEMLTHEGVVFPAGSSAAYSPDRTLLIVRNTQANLDLIDALIERSLKKQ